MCAGRRAEGRGLFGQRDDSSIEIERLCAFLLLFMQFVGFCLDFREVFEASVLFFLFYRVVLKKHHLIKFLADFFYLQ